jgi:uncharacterized protein YbaR (Trm112 family)
MMAYEYVEITSCPKCKGYHKYRLEVKRSTIIKALTMSDMNERSRNVPVTRIFNCPKTGEDYQATFTLLDTSSDRIESVTVVGEAGEDD